MGQLQMQAGQMQNPYYAYYFQQQQQMLLAQQQQRQQQQMMMAQQQQQQQQLAQQQMQQPNSLLQSEANSPKNQQTSSGGNPFTQAISNTDNGSMFNHPTNQISNNDIDNNKMVDDEEMDTEVEPEGMILTSEEKLRKYETGHLTSAAKVIYRPKIKKANIFLE